MINPIVVAIFFVLYVANAIYVDGWDSIILAFHS